MPTSENYESGFNTDYNNSNGSISKTEYYSFDEEDPPSHPLVTIKPSSKDYNREEAFEKCFAYLTEFVANYRCSRIKGEGSQKLNKDAYFFKRFFY